MVDFGDFVDVDSNVFFTTEIALSSIGTEITDAICSEIREQTTANPALACLEDGECVVVLE